MKKPRKEDRRIARTRAALRAALIALVIERGYTAVSIQDIAQRADVARTTFYLHYRDKDQLLISSLRDLCHGLLAQIPAPSIEELKQGRFPVLNALADFEHLAQYAPFYRAMMGEHGSPQFITEVRQVLAEAYETRWLQPMADAGLSPRLPLDLIAHLLAGVKISLVLWWVNHDMQPSPAEMQTIAEQFSVPGLAWALGISKACTSLQAAALFSLS